MVSGGTAPDLRESPIAMTRDAFKNVVVGGALLANGMPRFGELTDKDIDGLMHYIRKQARATATTTAKK